MLTPIVATLLAPVLALEIALLPDYSNELSSPDQAVIEYVAERVEYAKKKSKKNKTKNKKKRKKKKNKKQKKRKDRKTKNDNKDAYRQCLESQREAARAKQAANDQFNSCKSATSTLADFEERGAALQACWDEYNATVSQIPEIRCERGLFFP